ncbi:MAG: MFS transporter [Emcibacter sp.]|nr:MFS transporter [Emcibacter sp.]
MSDTSEKILILPDFIDNRTMGWFQIRTALICGIVMFLDGFDTQMIAYVAPFVGREWGLDNEALGSLFSASLLGLMIGYLAVAPFADRIGHKRMIVATVLGTSIFVLLASFATNVNELMIARFITGIGLGGVIPSAITLASEYSPKRLRATIVLAIFVGYSLGFVVAGLVSGWLIPTYGWASIFLIGGVMTLAAVPITFFFLPDSIALQIRKGKNIRGVKNILCRIDPTLTDDFIPTLEMPNIDAGEKKQMPVMGLFKPSLLVGTLLLWVVFSVNLGEFYALQSWLPIIIEKQGFVMDMMVKGTSITTVGGIVAAFIIGPSMDRLNPYNVLAMLYLLGFFCLLIFGYSFQSAPWVMLLSSFFVGFCVSGGQKSVVALSAIFYPHEIRAAGVGWALGIGRIGAIAGPLIVGTYMDPSWPPTTIFSLMAFPMLFLSCGIFFLGKVVDRRNAAYVSKNIQ